MEAVIAEFGVVVLSPWIVQTGDNEVAIGERNGGVIGHT